MSHAIPIWIWNSVTSFWDPLPRQLLLMQLKASVGASGVERGGSAFPTRSDLKEPQLIARHRWLCACYSSNTTTYSFQDCSLFRVRVGLLRTMRCPDFSKYSRCPRTCFPNVKPQGKHTPMPLQQDLYIHFVFLSIDFPLGDTRCPTSLRCGRSRPIPTTCHAAQSNM